jgi:hypothetical protein
MYKSVRELTRDELIQLKQHVYNILNPSVSYGELAAVDELISDEEVYKMFASVAFVDDDFFK